MGRATSLQDRWTRCKRRSFSPRSTVFPRDPHRSRTPSDSPLESEGRGHAPATLECAATLELHGGRSSGWLEHLVVVQDVAGSNPVGRPKLDSLRAGRASFPGFTSRSTLPNRWG